MKIYILILLLFSFQTTAEEFKFDGLSPIADFEASFMLSNSTNSSYHAVLDCQSFFKKFDIYSNVGDRLEEYFLTMNECEQIYLNVVACLEKEEFKCLDTPYLLDTNCECQK